MNSSEHLSLNNNSKNNYHIRAAVQSLIFFSCHTQFLFQPTVRARELFSWLRALKKNQIMFIRVAMHCMELHIDFFLVVESFGEKEDPQELII